MLCYLGQVGGVAGGWDKFKSFLNNIRDIIIAIFMIP
jgi:hypothetical protein